MFTTRLRLCKCWKVSCACTVAFQEGEVGLLSLEWHWMLVMPRMALGVGYPWNGTGCCVPPGSRSMVSSLGTHVLCAEHSPRAHKPLSSSGCHHQPWALSPPVPAVPGNRGKHRDTAGSAALCAFLCLLIADPGNSRHWGGSRERILMEQRSGFVHILAHIGRMQRAEPDRAGNANLRLIYSWWKLTPFHWKFLWREAKSLQLRIRPLCVQISCNN